MHTVLLLLVAYHMIYKRHISVMELSEFSSNDIRRLLPI